MVHHIISECFKFKLQQNCTHNMQDKTAETHVNGLVPKYDGWFRVIDGEIGVAGELEK